MTPYQSTKKHLENTNKVIRPEDEASAEERHLLNCQLDFIDPFIRSIEHVFPYGFSYEGSKRSVISIVNEALRDNHNLVGGVLPNLRINYHELIISKGLLRTPVAKTYQLKKTIARLEWDRTTFERGRKADTIYWMQYNATTNHTIVWEEAGIRTKGYFDIKMNPKILKDELHHWMFFTSPNGKMRSNSVYLGQLNTSFFSSTYFFNHPKPTRKNKLITAEKPLIITK